MLNVDFEHDRVCVSLLADKYTDSELFGLLTRVGRYCRERAVRKIIYFRQGTEPDPVRMAQFVEALPGMGYRGCLVAMVVPGVQAAYPLLYLESMASRAGVQLHICSCIDEA